MLEFACPRCAQLIEPEENQMGQSMICSGCQSSIKVPGSHGQNSDKTVDQKTWNVFEDDEAFFETTEKPSTGVPYRTREDDKEAVVDDDAAALADEEREQQAAVAESLAKAKFESGSLDLGASTPLTSEEKMKEDDAFRKMMKDLPDGQLFWIIRNGSPGTGMPAFKNLKDREIWLIVHYLRKLSEPKR